MKNILPISRGSYMGPSLATLGSLFGNGFAGIDGLLTDSVHSFKNEDGSYTYVMDVPGVTKGDIAVELLGGSLKVIANNSGLITRSYNQTFSVPSYVKDSDITASLENGVLTIGIAKCSTGSVSKTISVK
jgi:HSP20 family molecular chaperone IbpA